MNHKQVLKSVVVQCPAIPKDLANRVVWFLTDDHRGLKACKCSDCVSLKRLMLDPPLTMIDLSFSQATTVLHALRISAKQSDYCLGFAEHLCHLLGIAIGRSTEPSGVLHQLEQAHAHTREQVRLDRLRLWFAREFTQLDLTNERFEKLMNEVRLLLAKNEFVVNDECGFHFDARLRDRVATLADWLAKQVK